MNKAEQLITCLEGEIAKRDETIARLEPQLNRAIQANYDLREELAALKAQDPVAWPEGGSDAVEGAALGAFDSLGQPEHDLESWCAGYAEAVYAHAAPVSEAKAQGVVMPERDAVIRKAVGMCNRIPGSTTWNAAEYAYDELVAILYADPAAPAADADSMADAFMSWKLPDSVRPDGCAMDPTYPHRYGTNLMTWAQAKEMFEYVLVAHRAKGVV